MIKDFVDQAKQANENKAPESDKFCVVHGTPKKRTVFEENDEVIQTKQPINNHVSVYKCSNNASISNELSYQSNCDKKHHNNSSANIKSFHSWKFGTLNIRSGRKN